MKRDGNGRGRFVFIVQNDLSPDMYIVKITGKTYNLLKDIGAAFEYMGKDMMKLIASIIQPSERREFLCCQ